MSKLLSLQNRLKRIEYKLPPKKEKPHYVISYGHIELEDSCVLCGNIRSEKNYPIECPNKLSDEELHNFMDEKRGIMFMLLIWHETEEHYHDSEVGYMRRRNIKMSTDSGMEYTGFYDFEYPEDYPYNFDDVTVKIYIDSDEL